MSDQNFSDLDALLDQLDEVTAPAGAPGAPARLIVATDWSKAAAPLAVLRAFRSIIAAPMPVQLAFAVPHEPSEADAQCVQVLLEGLGQAEEGAADTLAGLEVVSFEEAAAQPYDSAVVPTGDPEELLTQVAGFIVRMHDLTRRLDRAVSDDTVNRGDGQALKDRLARFVA